MHLDARPAKLDAEGSLHVLGAGVVTIVDAHDMRYTDSHAVHRGQPLAMLGVRLDVLTSGCRYDLERRIAHPPPPGTVRLDAAAAAEHDVVAGPTLADQTADRGD